LAQPSTKLLVGIQRLAFATETAGAKLALHVLQVPRVWSGNEIELYSSHLSMIPNSAHSLTVALLTLTATPGSFVATRAPVPSHASSALQKSLFGAGGEPEQV
jgi:hypothetical protein